MRPLISALLPAPFDDRGVVLVDDDLLGPAQLGQLDVFQLAAQALEDGRAAGQDGDVFQHGLAAIAVTGGLDGGHLDRAAELVDHQHGQRFAIDVFGHDQQRLARVDDLLQHRHQFLDVG